MHDLYKQCLCIARIAGKTFGYAIGLHGTAERDLDLIAVPWVERPSSPEDLARYIAQKIHQETGKAIFVEGAPIEQAVWPAPAVRPHGRVSYTILLGGTYWVDLSIMPRITNEEQS
jgi:hypothetical protein